MLNFFSERDLLLHSVRYRVLTPENPNFYQPNMPYSTEDANKTNHKGHKKLLIADFSHVAKKKVCERHNCPNFDKT